MNSAYDTLAMINLAHLFACTVLKDTELHHNRKQVKCVHIRLDCRNIHCNIHNPHNIYYIIYLTHIILRIRNLLNNCYTVHYFDQCNTTLQF